MNLPFFKPLPYNPTHLITSITKFPSQQVKYITGRERKPGQVNGKSENLNNALKNHIFPKDCLSTVSVALMSEDPQAAGRRPVIVTSASSDNRDSSGDGGHGISPRLPTTGVLPPAGKFDWFQALPAKELVVVFDADMRAKPDFFLKTLEVMADEEMQLCLTPQAFHNIDAEADLFNNLNKQFWEVCCTLMFGEVCCTLMFWEVCCTLMFWEVCCTLMFWEVCCTLMFWEVCCTLMFWEVCCTLMFSHWNMCLALTLGLHIRSTGFLALLPGVTLLVPGPTS